MDIMLRPPMNRVLIGLINLMTLGGYPILRRMGERHFIRRMDEAGFETRGGRRVAWGEVAGIKRVVATVAGAKLSEEVIIRFAKGRASLPLWRAGQAEEALDFLLRRLPAEAGNARPA